MRRAAVAVALVLAAPLAGCGHGSDAGVAPGPGSAVLALDAASGRLLWRKEVSPPSASTDPVLVAGVVAVPSAGPLVAHDARTGERLWALEGVGPFPPLVAGDLLVLVQDDVVRAVEARTGRLAWQVGTGEQVAAYGGPLGVALVTDGTPALPSRGPGGEPPVVAAVPAPRGSTLRLLGPDGVERWRRALPGHPDRVAVAEDAVVAVDREGPATALAGTDGRVLWRAVAGGADVLAGASRTVVRGDADLVGLDPASGAQRWRTPAGGAGRPLLEAADVLLDAPLGGPPRLLRATDGTVLRADDAGCYDAALAGDLLVTTCEDVVRATGADGREVWRHDAATGPRPYLNLDAGDGVVVALAGWGQPATRD